MTAAVLELPVAYRDVRAADLRLHLGLPPQEALVVHLVAMGGWHVELRILGGSHQVRVERGGGTRASETVACHLGDGVPGGVLPARHDSVVGGGDYRFRSRTLRPSNPRFGQWVDRIASGLTADPLAVCGVFPGDALALTGVQVRAASVDGLAWRTVHTYPQTGEVVVTATRLGAPARTCRS